MSSAATEKHEAVQVICLTSSSGGSIEIKYTVPHEYGREPMTLNDVIQLLRTALEASVYVAPTDPGLTMDELYEVGKQAGLKPGEIDDAMPRVATQYFGPRGNERFYLEPHHWSLAASFFIREDPELRNIDAFDFVVSELNELAREHGAGKTQMDRNIMIARAASKGLQRHDVELATALLVLSSRLVEDKGVLRFQHPQGGESPLPSASRNSINQTTQKGLRTRLMPYVRDVIQRRADGRSVSADPFDAFEQRLEGLGHGKFRLWWAQTANELNRTEPTSSPMAALVLAAALVEGALAFVVARARAMSLGVFGSKDFDGPPTQWRIDNLVAGAARGGDDAIFDANTKTRAEWLIRSRQRIHAGRMLVEFPQGVPDLRPEEAANAKVEAQLIVRRILDWLDKHPVA